MSEEQQQQPNLPTPPRQQRGPRSMDRRPATAPPVKVPPAAAVSARCEEVVVQFIIRQYDASGRPVAEAVTAPQKLFRAQSENFWDTVDLAVNQMAGR